MKSSFNFGAIKSAANAAWQTAASTAKDLSKAVSQEVVGAKCLLDYTLQGQVASGGPGCLWKIYIAKSKKEGAPYQLVSAWILDKRTLQHDDLPMGGAGATRGGAVTRPSAKRLEAFLDQCRRDVQHLARLKHPSILRLVSPLEETRTQLVFITEPVFASLEDVLHGGHGLHAELAQERRALRVSELEVKHGLLQVSEGLHFLHSEAGVVHREICPSSIFITRAGSWKLGGFGQAVSLEYSQGSPKPFDYSDSFPPLLVRVMQPPLPYAAPELVASSSSPTITSSSDVFSLALVTYEALTRRQLLPVENRLADYKSKLASIALMDLAGLPLGLEQVMRQMLAPSPAARPSVAAFAGCQYFQGDTLLRALRFLDTMIQRDPMQKAAFLKDLPGLCTQLDTRVLKLKVLPPLLQELRSEDLQPLLLPLVLRMVECQDSSEFAEVTLPTLRPLLASAQGEALLLLTQHAALLGRAAPKAVAAEMVPQLLVRAAEKGDARCQEEMLRQVGALADSLDYEGLKLHVLPAVQGLCLNTTSAAVRVGAFTAMGKLVGRLDQAEAAGMLGVMAQVTSVDKTPGTTLCVLGLGDSLARQWGPRLAAERVLPVLCPLLTVPSLNTQQFGSALRVVREILGRVERARGDVGGGGSGSRGGSVSGSPSFANAVTGVTGRGGGTPDGEVPRADDWLAATSTVPTTYHGPSQPGRGGTPAAAAAALFASGGSGHTSTASSPLASGGLGGPAMGAVQGQLGGMAAAASGQLSHGGEVDLFAGTTLQGGGARGASGSQTGGWAGGPGVGGRTVQPLAGTAGASDPFAWPPPAPSLAQQAQQQLGAGGKGRGGHAMGVGARGGASAGSMGGGSTSKGATADPFAGLTLAGPGSGIGATAAAASVDPFDSLLQDGGRQHAQQQWQQGPITDSLI